MKNKIKLLLIFLSVFIAPIISYAAGDCPVPNITACTINENFCLNQPNSLYKTQPNYSIGSYMSNGGCANSCCYYSCIDNANFNGTNCVCNNTYYYVSSSNTCESCTSNCSVSNGIASISTNTNNQCVYTINCSTGYELSTNNCTPTGGTATCTAKHYDVTLKNYDNSEAVVHDVIFNQPMPNLPSGLPILRAGYVFNGYKNDSGNTYYDASGNSARNWDIDTTTPKLYDSWSACATGAAGNGTITNVVVNNICKYYITCISGFQNTVSYNIDTAGTNSTLTCSTCSPGYFCPGGERQPCPAGMTSSSGATQENDCVYKGGASGTKFCDSNGCLHLPINIGY